MPRFPLASFMRLPAPQSTRQQHGPARAAAWCAEASAGPDDCRWQAAVTPDRSLAGRSRSAASLSLGVGGGGEQLPDGDRHLAVAVAGVAQPEGAGAEARRPLREFLRKPEVQIPQAARQRSVAIVDEQRITGRVLRDAGELVHEL